MPVIAKAMEPGIEGAFNLQNAATPKLKALALTAAIAGAVPSGIFPPQPPTPLAPSGFSATKALFENAFTLDKAATPKSVAQGMATAISKLVPSVPPVGQKLLEVAIQNALSLDKAATPGKVATLIATGIVAYYTAAGVV
jgi:hypothetical protein